MNPAVRVFDQYAEDYDLWFDTHPEIYHEQLAILHSHLPRNGTGLEVGVGSGRYAAPLGIRHGLDPSESLLSRAYVRGIEPVRGIGESLPYHSGIFDYVLMMTVICFMDDIVTPFREAYRVLRPEGTLIIGFIEKSGEIARQERGRKLPGRFLRHAEFRSTEEVIMSLAAERFSDISQRENLHGLCIITAKKSNSYKFR
jgi:ubiquinone/menaquinone biosynthesis C-methylase UbiE